jgi:hypothetical protein
MGATTLMDKLFCIKLTLFFDLPHYAYLRPYIIAAQP